MDMLRHQGAARRRKHSRKVSPEWNIWHPHYLGLLLLLLCVSLTSAAVTAAKAASSAVKSVSSNTSLRNIEDENGKQSDKVNNFI